MSQVSIVPVTQNSAVVPVSSEYSPRPQRIPTVQGTPVAPGQAQVTVKPYCGATNKSRIVVQEAWLSRQSVTEGGPPKWADLALASRMASTVVKVQHTPTDGTAHLQQRFSTSRCIFRFLAVLLSICENVFAYCAYAQIKNPEDELYNKYEAHAIGFKGLDIWLLILAATNSLFLFAYWAMVAVVKFDLYRALTMARLLLSLPVGAITVLVVMCAESTKLFPFFCATCVLMHLEIWLFNEYRVRKQEGVTGCKIRIWVGLMIFFGIVLVMWTQMFFVDAIFFVRDKNCPASKNIAMPVHIKEIDEWHCVKWKRKHYIKRVPATSERTHEAFCDTSFRNAFDDASGNPSLKAHYVRCPKQCQSLGLGTSRLFGCGVYHADSSICAAAVHMGLLEPDTEGVVKVIGRQPFKSGMYERCHRNGILSKGGSSESFTSSLATSTGCSCSTGTADSSALAPAPVPAPAPAVQTSGVNGGNNNSSAASAPTAAAAASTSTGCSCSAVTPNKAKDWAFYFQMESTKDLDMITLEGWKMTTTPSLLEPWKAFTAQVSWVVGGTSHSKEVKLGRPEGTGSPLELNFCHVANSTVSVTCE